VGLSWLPLTAALDPLTGETVVLGDNGTVSLLDTASGRLVRQRALGGWGAGLALDPTTATLVVSGWHGDGGWVRLLDAASLHPRRTVRLRGPTGAVAVAVRTRRVFVLHPTDKTVSLLDEQGRVLGTIRVGQSEGAGVMTVDDATQRVFVANTHDSTVSVLDDRSGRVLRMVRVGARPDTLLVDDRANRVVVVNTDDGTLSVLDAATGALRSTLVVGPNPAAAVDESTGRLVVVSGASAPPTPSWVEQLTQQVPWLPWHLTPAATLPGSVRLLDLTH
jgi:YVTN family beta-propeller protein